MKTFLKCDITKIQILSKKISIVVKLNSFTKHIILNSMHPIG